MWSSNPSERRSLHTARTRHAKRNASSGSRPGASGSSPKAPRRSRSSSAGGRNWMPLNGEHESRPRRPSAPARATLVLPRASCFERFAACSPASPEHRPAFSTRVRARYNAQMKPLVGIIMGSSSDWETMQASAALLDQLAIAYEVRVVSAHRTPDLLFEYAAGARSRGLEVIIAGAGGAAHLPGMTAAKTTLPVLGVPVQSRALNGLDSLLSIVQMPAGIPVATFAIGTAGAANAALCAAAILGNKHPLIEAALRTYREQQTAAVLQSPDPRTSGA